MITGYRIDNNILYFYFDFSYEFGSDHLKEENLLKKVLNYIKDNKIKFNGTKIMFIASGIIISSLLFNNEEVIYNYNGSTSKMILENIMVDKIDSIENVEQVSEIEQSDAKTVDKIVANQHKKEVVTEVVKEEPKKEVITEVVKEEPKKEVITEMVKEEPKKEVVTEVVKKVEEIVEKTYTNPITIYRSNDTILILELEEYLIGVVGAEMPASFNIEALKAQAVASRTYALKMIREGKRMTDTESTQTYNDNNQLLNKWGSEYTKYYNKIKSAVESTKGIYMTYNNYYIDAVYHASNNGYTVSSIDVWGNDIPYLKSVQSSFDIGTTSYLRKVEKTIEEVSNILNMQINSDTEINITRDTTNHVKTISIKDKTYTGVQFRNLLKLRSTDFDIEINDKVVITTRGYGHGVGMSQYGAGVMANNGYNYRQILNHYYSNIKILP